MPERRPRSRGSFGAHFDELIPQFPAGETAVSGNRSTSRPRKLQEKIDIHGLLFERAWQLDEDPKPRSR